jgi:hypothetical protein
VLLAGARAKPVVFRTTPAPAACAKWSTASRHAGSLSEATATGSGFTPASTSTLTRSSNIAVLPVCKWLR